jgi:photosystem II stability/assembly factor-like uncharacterized protein
MTRRTKWMIYVAAALAVVAGAFVVGLRSHGSKVTAPARAMETAETVINARMVSGDEGWALTPAALSWTTDGGSTWQAIGPPGVSGGQIESVYFANAEEGTVIAAGEAEGTGETDGGNRLPVLVFKTVDGGRSWTSSRLPDDRLADVGSTVSSFSDAAHGVVMIREGSLAGAGARVASAWATDDGGNTWSPLPIPPVAGYLSFASPTLGWLDGGTDGSSLYRTTDGGSTWQPVALPVPAEAGPIVSYGLPELTSAGAGLLPVTYNDGQGRTEVGVWETQDFGETWGLSSLVPLEGVVGPGSDPPDASFITPESLVIQDPGSAAATVVSTPAAARQEGAAKTQELPAASAPSGLMPFAAAPGGGDAFGVVERNSCTTKTECTSVNELLVTEDGGRTWSPAPSP